MIFLIAIIISFYIPGRLILSLLKIKLDREDNFILSWLLGIAIFFLATYASAWVRLDYLPFYLSIIVSILFILYKFWKKTLFTFKPLRFNSPVILMILLGALTFSSFMFYSGFLTDKGLQFFHVNAIDGIRHMSYIKNMIIHFPPEQPGLFGVELRGFHYSYDFILSRFSMYFDFTPEDLYFRFFPFLISTLYGGAFYLAGKSFRANNIKILWILFFAYFSQSFSFLLFLINKETDLVLHSIVQPIGLIVNPFTVLSIAFLVAAVSFFTKIKYSWKYAFIVGLMLGIISQMKVYAGLIGIGSIILYSLYAVLVKKEKIVNFFIAVATTGFLTAVTYLPNNFMSGGLSYTPMLFYKQYMQQEFFDSVMQWELKRQVYALHNNYPRIILLYIQAVFIFMMVNLGLRAVVLLKIKKIFKKKFWKNDLSFIWLMIFIVPVFLASFYIQSGGSEFDTVQFFWISIAILSVPSGIVFGDIFSKKGKIAKIIIVLFVLAVSLPELIRFSQDYYVKSPNIVSPKSLEFMEKVKSTVPNNKFLVFVPLASELNKKDNLFLSAMTGRSFYVEPGNIPNKKIGLLLYERRDRILNLSESIKECRVEDMKKFITIIGGEYIITDTKSQCLSDNFKILNHYSSNGYFFYHLIID